MNKTTNTHTHVFNARFVPDLFLAAYIPTVPRALIKFITNLLRKEFTAKFIIRLLPKKYGKFKAFLSMGTKKTQDMIFEELSLKSGYEQGTQFVVLPLNFHHMEAGSMDVNYIQQLDEIISLKRKNPETCIPFVHIDPNAGTTAENKNFVEKYIEQKGFAGIKLYPSLGYFPFDVRLEKVYEYASKKEIPIITHCSNGGVYYFGEDLDERLNGVGRSFNPQNNCYFYDSAQGAAPPRQYRYTQGELNKDVATDYFLQPENYMDALTAFPKLKICFAHTGGDLYFRHAMGTMTSDDLKYNKLLKNGNATEANNWFMQLKKLLTDVDKTTREKKFPNIYVDISYTLSYPQFNKEMVTWLIANPATQDRVLFGTDFFMTLQENGITENILLENAKKDYGALFQKIAGTNAENFLRTRI